MSKLIQDLIAARATLEVLSKTLNEKVEHVLLLLIRLVDNRVFDDEDIWWWFGVDDDRPFRRGDRHGYLRASDTENITVYLDEPHISLPGFDQYVYNTPRNFSQTKIIPARYLSMSDEDIIADATTIITKVRDQDRAKQQAHVDAKNAVLAKLTDEEKLLLGLKHE